MTQTEDVFPRIRYKINSSAALKVVKRFFFPKSGRTFIIHLCSTGFITDLETVFHPAIIVFTMLVDIKMISTLMVECCLTLLSFSLVHALWCFTVVILLAGTHTAVFIGRFERMAEHLNVGVWGQTLSIKATPVLLPRNILPVGRHLRLHGIYSSSKQHKQNMGRH